MSQSDDLCDWCGSYVDPIGGDLARVVGRRLWCGTCSSKPADPPVRPAEPRNDDTAAVPPSTPPDGTHANTAEVDRLRTICDLHVTAIATEHAEVDRLRALGNALADACHHDAVYASRPYGPRTIDWSDSYVNTTTDDGGVAYDEVEGNPHSTLLDNVLYDRDADGRVVPPSAATSLRRLADYIETKESA